MEGKRRLLSWETCFVFGFLLLECLHVSCWGLLFFSVASMAFYCVCMICGWAFFGLGSLVTGWWRICLDALKKVFVKLVVV
jgi:hypothetical protein